MAGSYPDAPSRRMAWDDDGTAVLQLGTGMVSDSATPSGIYTNTSDANKIIMNDEYVENYGIVRDGYGSRVDLLLLFPEKREVDGVYRVGYIEYNTTAMYGALQTSGDATTGHNGTWVNENVPIHDADYYISTLGSDHYRNNITSLALNNRTAVRHIVRIDVKTTAAMAYITTLHVYGVISPGETPDRIIFLDTENSDAAFTKVLDFGDVPRGQTQTRQFKLKNNSATKTLNTIQVTAEDLYLEAGDWYTFGDVVVSYQATHAIGNLGPGATAPLYMKQVVADAANLGVRAARIHVSHASVT